MSRDSSSTFLHSSGRFGSPGKSHMPLRQSVEIELITSWCFKWEVSSIWAFIYIPESYSSAAEYSWLLPPILEWQGRYDIFMPEYGDTHVVPQPTKLILFCLPSHCLPEKRVHKMLG
jgi:hypothetical protein